MQTINTRGTMPPPTPRAPAAPANGYAAPPAEGQPPLATIELAEPVAWHREVVSVISLRKPTYGDYVECGAIMRHIVSDDPDHPGHRRMESIEDAQALTKWMSRLSGMPETFLKLLSWRDGKAVASEVAIIVADMQGNSSGAPAAP